LETRYKTTSTITDEPTSTITEEPPSKRQRQASPGPIESPKTFKDALYMIVALWKTTYPKLKFPLKLIVFFPTKKAPLVTTKQDVTTEATKLVCDIELTTGQVLKNVPIDYEITGCSMLRKKKDSLLLSALKTTLQRLRNKPTRHTTHLLPAFCATHPQIAP
jgi:hypothetical protein